MSRSAENGEGNAPPEACSSAALITLRVEAEDLLAEGVRSRKSAWRCLAVATVGRDQHPELRNLVLRGYDRADRKLRFHTDVRSRKWAQLEQHSPVSILGYDPVRQLQIRLRGAASLHHGDAIAQAAWEKSHIMSRACYTAAHAPGTQVDTPPAAPVYGENGVDHFGVLIAEYAEMEVLKLSSGGHRRARFFWTGETFQDTWLAP